MSADEIARRGDEIFARVVGPRLTPANAGRFVAIDIDTEDYELDHHEYEVVERAGARRPGARLWLVRVDRPYRLSYRMMRALRSEEPFPLMESCP